MRRFIFGLSLLIVVNVATAQQKVYKWEKAEFTFTSEKEYTNPIYEVKEFRIQFTAPSGRIKNVNGFWDGAKVWKVRFMPDESGRWTYRTFCSDKENKGLDQKEAWFNCLNSEKEDLLYQKGAIIHEPGKYYFSYSDGTPFFWMACTAWNGALKSSPADWDFYLDQRKENHYNTIQLVITEWRGCDKNAEGLTAIDGTANLQIHPEFFKRMDERIDEANAKGMLVSPVILWALPTGQGRYLSPGYSLPLDEAVLLAKYIVARYQGNHVVWTLGGDGNYINDQEMKWKEIGRRVFNAIDHAPVTIHPQGTSWVGELFSQEKWYDMMGYQSSHSNGERTVNWINKGPVSEFWRKLKPMPYINMEPNYEEIGFRITAEDVRNASYWSLFATPVAGVTYGANGIWPWLAEGEKILNHSDKGGTTGWRKSIEFPGSIQMGYLAQMFQKLEWWRFYPANELLLNQPGDSLFNHWISVLMKDDHSEILVYIPKKAEFSLYNSGSHLFDGKWFNPLTNEHLPVQLMQNEIVSKKVKDAQTGELKEIVVSKDTHKIHVEQSFDNDMVLILKRKE